MIRLPHRRAGMVLVFALLWPCAYLAALDGPFVSVYDDASDSAYGRSVSRSVVRSVRLDRFGLYRTLPVEKGLLEGGGDEGFLTPLVFSDSKKKRLDGGAYSPDVTIRDGRYRYRAGGVDITFTLEKPGSDLYREIEGYYEEWPEWLEPVKSRYESNWVIRIHRAENVFEPWIDLITYNEALLSASLIADREQWLWGVHDGADILIRN